MSSAAEELLLRQGESGFYRVFLLDENDKPENLIGADRATVTVRESVSSVTALFSHSTTAASLSILVGDSMLQGLFTESEADALTAGVYLGQAEVRFGSNEARRLSKYFHVRVLPRVAAKS